MDRLPASKYHAVWVVVLGIAMLIETYDNTVFAFLAPSIRAEWNLTLGQVGVITSAVFVGMMVGAIAGGRLSDRYGRRPVLIWASVLYSAMSLLSAIAPNYEVLTVSRVLTGVGVQAATGVVMVYAGEMFPKLVRGRAFSILLFIGYFGTPLTALTALAIAPTGLGAWRWVFVIGAAGFLIAIAAALWLPETVRWLVMRGRDAQAERIVERLEASVVRSGGTLGDVAPALPATPQGSYRDLLQRHNLKRLIVTALAFCGYIYTAYGFLAWVPTILTDRGMPQAEALGFATVLSFSTVVGPLVMFSFTDKIERKTTLLLTGLLCAASLVVFAFAPNPALSMVAGFGTQLGISMMGAAFYTYIPEIFPTNIRGLGFGVVSGIARVAGIISGLTIAVIYAGLGYQGLYVLLAVVITAAGLLVATLGPRTTNRSLESISESSGGASASTHESAHAPSTNRE
ncbi:MFS transporter [Paenarthrobacter sp. AT5]|uniref:MFS transporter n=1 Tax=Paenarthrobacter TaxID=1742992 RepID=UPI001A99CDE1|nr:MULTISPECIES: MFS transporter [Paenarthrobacter]WOC62734.1 MFS transporter [Paenarthrobacter sp. AT5]